MGLRDIVTDPALIYIDGHQDYANLAREDNRFRVVGLGWHVGSTPRSCDVAWWNNGKLFALEEKKPLDFSGSVRSRRLQRELRGVLAEADVPILGLRTRLDLDYIQDVFGFDLESHDWPLMEASKWAVHGLTVFLPSSPEGVLGYLVRLRDALTPAGARSIIAGSDTRKRPQGSTPFQRWVRRLFDGVGPVLAEKLDKYFNGNFMLAINAPPGNWRAAGAHKGVVKQVEELHDN